MDKHISQGCSRIESLQNDEEVKCIVEINKDTYFYWFIDYSACFFNAKGERIEAPINEFDFILDFKTLGHIDGKEHYVFKATNWGTQRDHVFMICDIDGETKTYEQISLNIFVPVDKLPETGENNKIYLVPANNGTFDEYYWINGKWEILGNVALDLSDYPTFDQMNSAIDEAIYGALGGDY